MNVYPIEGIVTELKETVVFNSYFSKREFKIRYTEQDLSNKIVEQKLKLVAQDQETIDSLNSVRVDDQVKVKFYISGKDVAKKDNPEVIMNFTTLVAIEVEILSSPTRDTKKDKDSVITGEGKVYKDPLVEASVEELAGMVTAKELEAAWDKKKDKYGLNEEPNAAAESMKSKILNKEDDPFSDVEEVNQLGDKIEPLPF